MTKDRSLLGYSALQTFGIKNNATNRHSLPKRDIFPASPRNVAAVRYGECLENRKRRRVTNPVKLAALAFFIAASFP
jgi:hypothetical protein